MDIGFTYNNKIIGFGKIDKSIIIPISFTIFLFCFYHFFENLNSIITAHCIINILFCHLASFVLSLVLFCIKYFRSKNFKKPKKVKSKDNNSNSSFHSWIPSFIRKDKEKYNLKNYILISCQVILTISLSLSYILRIKLFNLILQSNLETIFIFLQMILTLFFVQKIIKYKLEKHNHFGFFLMLIGIIINTICFIIYKEYFYIKNRKFWIIAILSTLIISYREVLEKYFMEVCFINSYLIILVSDFFSVIFFWILLSCEKIKNESINNYIKDNSTNLICSCLFFSSQNILRIVLNEQFSPTHRIISDLLVSICLSIKRIIETHIPGYYVPPLITGFFFMILGILVYNELIILYFWDLEKNVKYMIKMREKSDLLISLSKENYDKKDIYLNNSQDSESSSIYSFSKSTKFN